MLGKTYGLKTHHCYKISPVSFMQRRHHTLYAQIGTLESDRKNQDETHINWGIEESGEPVTYDHLNLSHGLFRAFHNLFLMVTSSQDWLLNLQVSMQNKNVMSFQRLRISACPPQSIKPSKVSLGHRALCECTGYTPMNLPCPTPRIVCSYELESLTALQLYNTIS